MKRIILPDSGGRRPEVLPWPDMDLGADWQELIAKIAPGTSPSDIQRICLGERGMLGSRRNLIVSSPTNSGKSLIGHLFLFDAVRRGKRGLLLEPLRALAQEKFEELLSHRAAIEKFIGRKFTPKITTGDYSLDEETLSSPPPEEGEIVIATPERIEVILRHPAYDGWVGSIGAVCVDEAHQISCQRRGGSLEFVIASFLSQPAPPRFLLLSATLGSTDQALRWLDPCDLAESDVRWPALKREILVTEGEEKPDAIVLSLAKDILSAEGAALAIFVYRKADANRLADFLRTGLGATVLAYHSNMPFGRKEQIRNAYLSGQCRAIVSTTALGTGINLPSTHLIIRDTTFYPDGKIPPSQLIQMMGRAGRGEREGHAMVLLREADAWDPKELEISLIDPPLPELRSGLFGAPRSGGRKSEGAPQNIEPAARLVLSLLCRAGDAGFTREQIERFAASMLAGEEVAPLLHEALQWLTSPSNVLAHEREEDGALVPTRLGSASAKGGLPPGIAAAVGRLMRDLFSVDEDLRILPGFSTLDILVLAELVAERTFLGGAFSHALATKVDGWMEKPSHDNAALHLNWIRGNEETSKAEELFGSLGLSAGPVKAGLARKHGYLKTRAAAVLWMRGRGDRWEDIARTWAVDPAEIGEEEWIRNRSWLISGFAEVFDIRCFYFHLKEGCLASDEKIKKAKNILRRMRAQCFQVLGRLKYCSPLGPLLVRMRSAGTKGVGKATIERLESAGLLSPQAISELSEDQIRELKLDSKRIRAIRSYLRRK